MKSFLGHWGVATLLLLVFIAWAFVTVDAGLDPNHGAPYWANTEVAKKGQKLFETAGCYACHSYRGQQGQVTGPNFEGVGKKYPKETIKKFIENPRAFYPNTIMPVFKDRLTPGQIDALAEYLSTFNKVPY